MLSLKEYYFKFYFQNLVLKHFYHFFLNLKNRLYKIKLEKEGIQERFILIFAERQFLLKKNLRTYEEIVILGQGWRTFGTCAIDGM